MMNQIFTLQNGWKSPFPYFPSIKKGLFRVPGNSLVLMVGLDKPRDNVKLWSNGGKNSKQMVVMPPFSIISIGSANSKNKILLANQPFYSICFDFFMVNIGGYSMHLVFGNIILVTVQSPGKNNCLMTIVNLLALAILQRPFSVMVPDIKRTFLDPKRPWKNEGFNPLKYG